MTLLTIFYLINVLLMVVLGIGLGAFLTRRFTLPWRLYWIGALTFVLSQVGHIPFNALVMPWLNSLGVPAPPEASGVVAVAIFVGLSSGLWEETSRWVMYRSAVKGARSWRQALVLGAGHGGIEAVLTGLLAGWVLFQAVALQGANDLSSLVPAERLLEIQAFLDSYWSAPWYATLLGALERALALSLHLAFSVLVLQVFRRGQARWWFFAVLWHAMVNGVTYAFLQFTQNFYLTELVLSLFTLGSILIVWGLRDADLPQGEDKPSEPEIMLPPIIQPPVETSENLENSKYN